MMDNNNIPPNELTSEWGLREPLRSAVEQVRTAVPPVESVERSIDRAQRLGPPRRRSRRWPRYSAMAGIAAAILVGFGLWPHQDISRPPETMIAKLSDKQSRQGFMQDFSVVPRDAIGENIAVADRDLKNADDQNRAFRRNDQLNEDKGPVPSVLASATIPSRPGQAPKIPADAKTAQDTRGLTNPYQRYVQGEDAVSRPRSESLQRIPEAKMTPPEAAGSSLPARRAKVEATEERSPMAAYRSKVADLPPQKQNAGTMDTDRAVGMGSRTYQLQALTTTSSQAELNASLALHQNLKDKIREQESILNKTASGQAKYADLAEGQTKDKDEAKKRLGEAQTQLRTVETRISELQSQRGAKPVKKEPQIWHRDRARPTFARVYIGDGNALELVSLHVNVTIEGPRARTVVDHIFRNPHHRQLEGTFEYPLPSGASPSYFAMFLGQTRDTMPVLFGRRGNNAPLPAEALAKLTPEELVKHVDTADWGRLQEGRIVSKEKALETYEEVVRGRVDPALLEYAGGNTFSGRVFPIPAKGYSRVILAYEELLPFTQEHMIYRFPLPGCKLNEMQFHLQAPAAECLQPAFFVSDFHPAANAAGSPASANRQRKLPGEERGGRVTFTKNWKDSTPDGEAVFACTPTHAEVQALSGRQGDNGPRYLYARLRPALKSVANGKPFASQAVFLLDTSLSEHPDRFAVNMKLLQKILENDSDIKRFNILTFNVDAAWLDPKGFFDNTAAGREKALKKLDGIVLEGATDISCALNELAAPGSLVPLGRPLNTFAPTPLNVFVLSDGHITWGEPDVAALAARFEQHCPYPTRFHCYRTGLGEENSELFEALTRQGGGVFQCYGEADLDAAARAHRSQCLRIQRVRFVGGPEVSDVLVSGRRAAVYPGGELVVAARFNGTGRTTVVVEGEFAGRKVVQEFPLAVRSDSELAPRAWAEIAVASLLALHDSNFDPLVTAYCQQFGIVSRVASFLVLENEADYKRFNLEEERGRTVAGDLGAFLADTWMQLGKRVPAAKAFERFLNQVNKRVNLYNGPEGAHVKQMLAVLTEEDFDLPASSIRGGLLYRKDAAGYVEERERDRRNVGVYLKEAQRRAEADDVDGAVRVLSSIIEEYPSRGDALRLVGYRLLDLQQPAQAARLFGQVQKQRPFEPHSYRDSAHALEQSGHYGLAAINYEILLAGAWHNRFREELKLVAVEEYAHMMQEAIRRRSIGTRLANLFGERLEQMTRPRPKSDLRVTISWNTDATDVDLWVIEPDGSKCFYQNNRTKSGGELSQDQTQGYGPERYQIAKAQSGVYTVLVHYFGVNANLLGGETHVSVTVSRFSGTPQETTQRHTIVLKKHNQQVEVCKVKF